MATSDDLKEVVRERCDLVEIIQRTVPLRRDGKNWSACCPFHEERTPSFKVSPQRQSYHCFGCGESGDVFKWVMQRDAVTFPEALAYLAEEAGVDLQQRSGVHHDEETSKSRLRAALEFARRRYREMLASPRGSGARKYLAERGIDDEVSREFGLGYTPDQPDGLLRPAIQAGFTPRTLEAAGLIKPTSSGRKLDMFQGRLMIPIADGMGRAVGFGARQLPPQYAEGGEDGAAARPGGKYINSPETVLFHKSSLFYGLDRVPRTGGVIAAEGFDGLPGEEARRPRWFALVEGYTDVIAAHQHGIPWVVAALGTALTEEHARILRRQQLHGVVLVFDGDDAGIKAALRSIPILLGQGLGIRVLVLAEGQDPADYLSGSGPEAFLEQVREAPAWLEFLDRRTPPELRDGGGEHAAAAVDWLLGFITAVDPLERDRLFIRIADILRVPEELVRHRFRAHRTAAGAPVDELPAASPRFRGAHPGAGMRTRGNGQRPPRGMARGPAAGRSGGMGSRRSLPPESSAFRGPEEIRVGADVDRMALRRLVAILVEMPSLCALACRDWPLERLTGILGDRSSGELEAYTTLLRLREEKGRVPMAELIDRCVGEEWIPQAVMGTESLGFEDARTELSEIFARFEKTQQEQTKHRLWEERNRAIEEGDEVMAKEKDRELFELLRLQKGLGSPESGCGLGGREALPSSDAPSSRPSRREDS